MEDHKCLVNLQDDEVLEYEDSSAVILPFSGKAVQLETPSGCRIALYDYMAERAMCETRVAEPMLQLCVMLDGYGQSWLEDYEEEIDFKPGYCSLLYSQRAVSGRYFIPKGTHIALIDLRFDTKYLTGLLPDFFDRFQQDSFQFCSEGVDGVWLARFPTPGAVQKLALEILSKDPDNACDVLWLEAKSVEILSKVTKLLESKPSGEQDYCCCLSLRDRRNIQQARDIMLGELDRDWTIRDLARLVGVNENKLKRGFNKLFDSSVYASLQEHRMMAAAEQIKLGIDSITDIAMSVGYSSPAHFAKVFRRYYGMSPRDYRKSA